MTYEQRYLWYALAVAAVGVLIYLLAPILAPFVAAFIIAYLFDPLVDRLERLRLGRTSATTVVFILLSVAVVALPLLLVPLLEGQLKALWGLLPQALDWLNQNLVPWLHQRFGVDPALLDLAALKHQLQQHWQQAGGMAVQLLKTVTTSGLALLGTLSLLLVVPVVTFYMLRDWDHFVAAAQDLLPRSLAPTVSAFAREADDTLSAFLRGQLLVMLCLGVFYASGLWLAGLDLALLVGLVAGLVSFVPYLGVIVGVALAAVAMLLQTQELLPLLWVALVFGIGQALEGMLLTPILVGDRVGLHPVTVIFAVLAGGQLFGFVGVLLALPVAAVLAVLIRWLKRYYQGSELYSFGPTEQESE